MAGWADIAACYRWMHDKGEKQMARSNMCITVPVIILSTLTGSANFILNSIVGDDKQLQTYATIGIGGVSIFTGILTTLGNFFRYAQNSESNRVSSIAWGKFQRQIQIELALHPRERIDSMDFLKICRAELDRMIEQSPAISDRIIRQFENEFKDKPNIKKPDIAHGMDHTQVFKDSDSRLKKMAADAAMIIHMKRKTLNEVIEPEMNRRIETRLKKIAVDLSGSLLQELERRTEFLEAQFQAKVKSLPDDKLRFAGDPNFINGGPAYLRSFNRGRAASISSTNSTPPSTVHPPPAPLTQKSVNDVFPSERGVSQNDLISALTERRVTYPESSFNMTFTTEENAISTEGGPVQHTVVDIDSEQKIEPPPSH